MAVRIRLSRCGARNQPFFRVVVADWRKPRDGKIIESIGTYRPRDKDNKVSIKKDRLEYWLKNGARLTQTVSELVRL